MNPVRMADGDGVLAGHMVYRTVDTPTRCEWYDLTVLARHAYVAYGEVTGGKNFQGNPMPAWDELPVNIRRAWELATKDVIDRVT